MNDKRRPAGLLRRISVIIAMGIAMILTIELAVRSLIDDDGNAESAAWGTLRRGDSREPWRKLRPGVQGIVADPAHTARATEPERIVDDPAGWADETSSTEEAGSVALQAAPVLSDIKVSLKQVPRSRRTRKNSMEARWIMPNSFLEVVKGTSFTVEARAGCFDSQGVPVLISPQWIPTDPGMVRVSPDQGSEVTITVVREGKSSLQIQSSGITKELPIHASYRDGNMIVRIAQGK